MAIQSPKRDAFFNTKTRTWTLWTRQHCLAALRLASVDGEPPRIAEYNVIHLSEPNTYPAVKTVIDKCGSWRKAVMMAGFKPRSRGKAGQRDYVRGESGQYDLEVSGEYQSR